VCEGDALRVREIFQLYLEYQALMPVLAELERRGWHNKRWLTRKGRARGGRPFTKPRLYELLRNVVYVGQVRYKQEVHQGEHAAIVDPVLWQQVQDLLSAHGSGAGRGRRCSSAALLGGLLRCQPCGCAMTPAQAARKGGKRYRYYVCTAAQRRGWRTCPSKALPAAAVEGFVLEQLRTLAAEPASWNKALGATLAQQRLLLADKEGEARSLDQELTRLRAAYRQASPAQRVLLQAPKRRAKERRATLRQEISALQRGPGSDSDRVQTLAALRNLGDAAATPEQGQIVQRRSSASTTTAGRASWPLSCASTKPGRRVSHPRNTTGKGQPMTTPYTIECTMRFGRQGRGDALCSTHPPSVQPVPLAVRIPRLARLMALALRLQKLLATGVVKDFRTLARLGHVSPARISQILSLLHLAPDIQEALLFRTRPERGRDCLGLRQVLPLTKVWDWHKQRRLWRGLFGQRLDVAATGRKRGVLLATGFGVFATDGRCRTPQPA
jgi:Recombinase zinc beta ribbon domain/Recombinase